MRTRLAAVLLLLAGPATWAAPAPVGASPPGAFARAVDEYLDRFGHFHPSIAAGNGLHAHDDELEDFSAATIAAELDWLRAERRALGAFQDADLTADERADRRILRGIIDGWILDLDGVRTWTRNPMVYVSALADGLHNLLTLDSAPAEVRLRAATRKLEQAGRLFTQARQNVRAPPRVFVERALAMLAGVRALLEHDLALGFAGSLDTPAGRELAAAAQRALAPLEGYRAWLAGEGLAQATGRFATGTAAVEARYRAEELIDLPAAALLKIGTRELARTQAAFAATAARLDAARPAAAVWEEVEARHPARGELVPAAQRLVDELFEFIRARDLVRLPGGERVTVAAAPAYDLGLASMHSSPPLEPHPVRSFYYVTDADPSWPPERQEAWLRSFNEATLADITAHEVAPGHYVHSVFMRGTPGKVRRIWIGLNPFPQPSSGQDGWAHYAEQLVSDEGFHGDDPRYRLAQQAEALSRICRLIAGLRLHSGEWSVEDAARLFEQEAHLTPVAARREAVRGTYDPTYGGYFLGRLALLKLREDYRRAHPADFSLREFHERVMRDGIAPWPVHRELLLPGDRGATLE